MQRSPSFDLLEMQVLYNSLNGFETDIIQALRIVYFKLEYGLICNPQDSLIKN